MVKIGIPDKINFHKNASEILYSYFLKSYLNKSKMENRVTNLEEKIKRAKDASKGCDAGSPLISPKESIALLNRDLFIWLLHLNNTSKLLSISI